MLIAPGGAGAHEIAGDACVLDWLRSAAAQARWVCSVCTGSFLLQAAGLANGRRITSHSGALDLLRSSAVSEVIDNRRYVVDGNLVTSAGVSAGIDMSLWVVGQVFGEDHARHVQRLIEYNPEPPYA